MKRTFWTLACLLGLCAAQVQANYIVIIVDLKKAPTVNRPNPNPGGINGNPGGEFGLEGGQPPGGNFGFAGGQNVGLGGGNPGGALGQFGNLGVQGGPGMPGPGPGMPGPGPGMPGPGQPGGIQGNQFPQSKDRVRVMAVIETKNQLDPRSYALYQSKQGFLPLEHKWGKTTLDPRSSFFETVPLRGLDGNVLPSALDQLIQKVKKLNEDASATTVEKLRLGTFALEHGLLKEFEQIMNKIAQDDPTDPVIVAYLKAKANMEAQPADPARELARWKQLPYNTYETSSSKHYVVLHRKLARREATRRLEQLEELYKGFYYYFAMQKQVLPVPKKKMIAVVVDGGREPAAAFGSQNEIFGFMPVRADSFYSPRHHILAFASRRLDEAYNILTTETRQLFDLFDPDEVLQLKKLPKPPSPLEILRMRQQGKQPDPRRDPQNILTAQTYSLVMKTLQDDARRTAVTHQGARQLIFESGMLAKNVQVPEWIQSGMGSFFEAPPSSPWVGYGTPHWAYFFSWQQLKKDFPDSDFDLLKEVITDTHFRKKLEKGSSVKARALAWALTQYLAHKRTDGLLRYFEGLKKLPRDLELSDDVMLDTFARAFDCVDPRTNKRNEVKLAQLARNWKNSMGDLTLEHRRFFEGIYVLKNELAEEAAKAKERPRQRPGIGGPGDPYNPEGPGNPGPGGFNPGPGPGNPGPGGFNPGPGRGGFNPGRGNPGGGGMDCGGEDGDDF